MQLIVLIQFPYTFINFCFLNRQIRKAFKIASRIKTYIITVKINRFYILIIVNIRMQLILYIAHIIIHGLPVRIILISEKFCNITVFQNSISNILQIFQFRFQIVYGHINFILIFFTFGLKGSGKKKNDKNKINRTNRQNNYQKINKY